MDPRNSNPFDRNGKRQHRSEYAANRDLAKSKKRDGDLNDTLATLAKRKSK